MSDKILSAVLPAQANAIPARKTDGVIGLAFPAIRFASRCRWFAFWLAVAFDSVAIGAAQLTVAGAFGVAIITRLACQLISPALPAEGARRPTATRTVVPALIVYFAILLLQAAATMTLLSDVLSTFPARTELTHRLEWGIDQGVDWMTVHFAAAFVGITAVLNWLISLVQYGVKVVPWPIAMIALGFVAWQKGGLRMAAFIVGSLLYFGLFGFWSETVETLSVVLASFVVCLLLGIPAGVACAKFRTFKAIVMPTLDVMQTMPSFVYLLPAVAFFSIGKPPALISTVIFSVPPLIRLTCLGVEQVPVTVREAMTAHGATTWQSLVKAELPLAGPSIRAGINQTIMLSLAMAVIASLIGAGGLGYDVLFALQNVQYGKGIMAGIAIVLSAITFDRLMRRSS